MATVDTTAMDYALKVRYSPDIVRMMAYKRNPWFARIKKKEDFGGKNFTFAVTYGHGPGRSVNFTRAQTNSGAALGEDFALTRVKDYAIAKIDSETVMASEGDANSLLSAVEVETDRKLHALIRSTAISLFRDGYGDIGQITSISTGVITLSNANDVTHFERDQVLQVASSRAAAVRATRGYVIAVNRDAGTVTVSTSAAGSAGTPAGWTANDFIFSDGDYNSGSQSKIFGLGAWVPSTAPTTGDSFFGVDRSNDVTRLAGHRLTGTGKTIEEALYDVAVRIAREGGAPNLAYTSYEKYAALNMQLGTKIQYIQYKLGEIAFEGVRINGPAGPIDVYPDQNCQSAVGWVLTEDSWCLKSLRAAPMFLDLDGKKWLRMSSEDGIEIRMAVFGNAYTDAPGWNGRTTL
jgi:hypothetical protein